MMLYKIAVTGILAAMAGVGVVTKAATPEPAYGALATRLEADAAARHAARLFDRADLNTDGRLDPDEFTMSAVVTAELARLNGFIAVDSAGGVRRAALLSKSETPLTRAERRSVAALAAREFAIAAGDDERLSRDEFVGAQLERFLAHDADRDGVLVADEIAAFAEAQARLSAAVG